MVALHPSTRQDKGGRHPTPGDVGRPRSVVEQLLAEIDRLSRERDSLRKVLIDAGFSLRAERIARYAEEVSSES